MIFRLEIALSARPGLAALARGAVPVPVIAQALRNRFRCSQTMTLAGDGGESTGVGDKKTRSKWWDRERGGMTSRGRNLHGMHFHRTNLRPRGTRDRAIKKGAESQRSHREIYINSGVGWGEKAASERVGTRV